MPRHRRYRSPKIFFVLTSLVPLAAAAVLGLVPAHKAWAQTTATEPAASAYAETSGPLSLQQALAQALASNADLAVARRELEAADGPVLQGAARPNPELSVLLEDLRQATRTTTFQVNQAIELGGKRAARIEAAERLRDIAAADLARKSAELRSAVVLAFRDVLLAQERVTLTAETTELARRGTGVANRRVQAGKVSPVEETKARIAEANAGLESLQAQAELGLARQRLAATWGQATPRFERAESGAADMADALPPVPTLQALSARVRVSPSLRRAQSEVLLRQAVTRVERSKATQDLTVSLGVKRDEQGGRNQVVVGLAMPFGVFDRNQGNLLEALKREDKSRDELTAVEVQLASAVTQARSRLEAAGAEARAIRDQVLPGAHSAYDAATKGFELGKFDFLDVLDAQRTLFQARAQYQRARGEALRAAIDIDRLLGDGGDTTASFASASVPASAAQPQERRTP